MDTAHHGSCLCKSIRLVATGDPHSVAACHCKQCRKHTGAPAAVFVDYALKNVEFTGETMRIYTSSKGVSRGFCGTCGSTLTYQADNLPDMIHLHIGVFDRPEDFTPIANESVESQLPWLHISTGEPKL